MLSLEARIGNPRDRIDFLEIKIPKSGDFGEQGRYFDINKINNKINILIINIIKYILKYLLKKY